MVTDGIGCSLHFKHIKYNDKQVGLVRVRSTFMFIGSSDVDFTKYDIVPFDSDI